jgi:branched-chain amino acid transport system substrate-binding protein
MFTMLGGDEALAGEGSGFIWPGADGKTAGPLGTYAAEDLGYEEIATLAPDYAYGKSAIQGATDAFEAAGGTVGQQQWVPLGTTDMLQYATALDKDVDALLMWLVPSDAAAFVGEYRNLGIDIPLLLFQGVFDPTYQEVGDQLLGEIGLNEYNHLLDYEVNAEFTEAYDKEFGGIPNQTTAFAYTVAQNILTALDEADGETSVDALREALDGKALDTVIGEASYNGDGIVASNRFVVKSVEGEGGRFEWEPLKTYETIGQ